MNKVLIIGVGGHGRVVADTLEALAAPEIAFLDDCYPEIEEVGSWRVIGNTEGLEKWQSRYGDIIVAIGDNGTRLRFVRELSAIESRLPVVIHPRAYVSSNAELGAGTVVCAGAVVQPGATLGRGCIINTGATVDHDCVLGDGVHISPGVNLGGGVKIGDCTWIGIGASVREYKRIGSNVLVGVGAAVISDVVDGAVVTGVPAKSNSALAQKRHQ